MTVCCHLILLLGYLLYEWLIGLNFFYGDDEVEVDVDDGDGDSDVSGITV